MPNNLYPLQFNKNLILIYTLQIAQLVHTCLPFVKHLELQTEP